MKGLPSHRMALRQGWKGERDGAGYWEGVGGSGVGIVEPVVQPEYAVG